MVHSTFFTGLWYETYRTFLLKKYAHLFFDLDGTIWDLQRNTRAGLEIVFERFADRITGIDIEKFYKRYHHHNDRVWALYRDGKIEKEVLRYVRFERAFEDLGYPLNRETILEFSNAFSDVCPRQPHTLDGAHELLKYCQEKYVLHIITNGFIEVQGFKMDAAQLNGYFMHMINSEHCGVRKPHAGIFEYALKKAGADKNTSLMIGDDWEADIIGARDYGIDQVFLTTTEEMMNVINEENGHAERRHNYKPTFSVRSLRELMDIL